jgi:hypothetical protein
LTVHGTADYAKLVVIECEYIGNAIQLLGYFRHASNLLTEFISSSFVFISEKTTATFHVHSTMGACP